MRISVLRSTRFSSRQSVGGEASGCVLVGQFPGGQLQGRVVARVWWSLRSSYPRAMARIL